MQREEQGTCDKTWKDAKPSYQEKTGKVGVFMKLLLSTGSIYWHLEAADVSQEFALCSVTSVKSNSGHPPLLHRYVQG